jgi:GDPmannose 4,6-dehydratase
MLQQSKPEDFVIATGKQYSVRDFINFTAEELDMKISWRGKNIHEIGSYKNKDIIKIDPAYFRPSEVFTLLGDPTKAEKKLGWSAKINLDRLIKEMVENDLELAQQELNLK